jgi:hypothetical protein
LIGGGVKDYGVRLVFFDNFSRNYARFRDAVKGARGQLDKLDAGFRRMSQAGRGMMIGGAALGAGLTYLAVKSLKTTERLTMFEIALKQVGYSAEEAQGKIDRFAEYATRGPFDIPNIVAAGTAFTTIGDEWFTVQKNAEATLDVISDMAARYATLRGVGLDEAFSQTMRNVQKFVGTRGEVLGELRELL